MALILFSCSSKFQATDRNKNKTRTIEQNTYSNYQNLTTNPNEDKAYSQHQERDKENKQLLLGIANDSIYTSNKDFKFPISELRPYERDSLTSNKNKYNEQEISTREELFFLHEENTTFTSPGLLEKPIKWERSEILAQLYLAYNTSSINFRERYIKITPPNLPSFEKILEPTTTDYGIDFGLVLGKEKLHIFIDSWLISTTTTNRGTDYAMGVSLGFGARYAPLKQKNHYVGWGIGIGGNSVNRNIYTDRDLNVSLTASKWIATPKILYEYQIPSSRISFFAQLRYMYDFGRKTNNSRVIYEELNLGRNQEDTRRTRFRLSSPYLEGDNLRLDFRNQFNLSFGVNYHF